MFISPGLSNFWCYLKDKIGDVTFHNAGIQITGGLQRRSLSQLILKVMKCQFVKRSLGCFQNNLPKGDTKQSVYGLSYTKLNFESAGYSRKSKLPRHLSVKVRNTELTIRHHASYTGCNRRNGPELREGVPYVKLYRKSPKTTISKVERFGR